KSVTDPVLQDEIKPLSQQDEEENINQSDLTTNHERKETSTGQANKPERRKKKTPFNVIMTPSDKKRLHEKKKQLSMPKTSLPSFHLLNDLDDAVKRDQDWIDEQSEKLMKTLLEFN